MPALQVEIDTQWNVNREYMQVAKLTNKVEIDTQWNVNDDEPDSDDSGKKLKQIHSGM